MDRPCLIGPERSVRPYDNICRRLIYGTLLASLIFMNLSCSGQIFLCNTIDHHGGVSIPFHFSQSNCTFSLLKSHKDYLFYLSLIVFLYFLLLAIPIRREIQTINRELSRRRGSLLEDSTIFDFHQNEKNSTRMKKIPPE